MGWQYIIKPRSEHLAKLHELIHELGEGKHDDITIYEDSGQLVFTPRVRDKENFVEKEAMLRIPRWDRSEH